MKNSLWLCLGVLLLPLTVWGGDPQYSFEVRHDHAIGSCRGTLILGDKGVEYRSTNKKDAGFWRYEDIQGLELASPSRISWLTYENVKRYLGKDRRLRFELTQGSIDESVRLFLQSHLAHPLVSGILPAPGPTRYRLAARHQHVMGGCQGTLEVGEESLIYRTSYPEDSRVWRYAEIESVASTNPFQLRVGILERPARGSGGLKSYVFDLKMRLEKEVYDFIWWKVHRDLSIGPHQGN